MSPERLPGNLDPRPVNQANANLRKERQALLALELTSQGVDIKRLGFMRWLRDNKQDLEWYGQPDPDTLSSK